MEREKTERKWSCSQANLLDFLWWGLGRRLSVEGLASGVGCCEAGLGGVAGLGGTVVHLRPWGQAGLWVFSYSLGTQNK